MWIAEIGGCSAIDQEGRPSVGRPSWRLDFITRPAASYKAPTVNSRLAYCRRSPVEIATRTSGWQQVS